MAPKTSLSSPPARLQPPARRATGSLLPRVFVSEAVSALTQRQWVCWSGNRHSVQTYHLAVYLLSSARWGVTSLGYSLGVIQKLVSFLLCQQLVQKLQTLPWHCRCRADGYLRDR